MKFLARLEADSLARSNRNLGPGPWIAADSRLTGSYIEHAESAKLYAVSIGQRFLQALKDCVDRGLGFHARQTGSFDYVMDDVLFNQCLHSETTIFVVVTSGSCVMLERFLRIVNARSVS